MQDRYEEAGFGRARRDQGVKSANRAIIDRYTQYRPGRHVSGLGVIPRYLPTVDSWIELVSSLFSCSGVR